MIDIVIGSSAFSILGCMVLLIEIASERGQYQARSFNFEPTYKVKPLHVAPIALPVFKPKPTRKKKTKGVQDVSKHMTLTQLRKIQTDNYCGEGSEYNAEQIEQALMARAQSKADNDVNQAIKVLTLANINF